MYRVLIVDDEPFIREGIRAFIDWEKEGMLAEDDCANGVEALAALKTRSVDILITDIKMPLMNGIELMEQALGLCPDLKVILISSYSDFEYVREGLKLGAVDYLLKPTMEPEELLAVLKRCIGLLEEERRKESELNLYQQGAIYIERKRLELEIKRLIVQEKSSVLSADLAPAWMEQSYACVYLMLDGADEWRENRGYLYVQLLLEDLQELFYRQVGEGAALLVAEAGMFMVFPAPEGETQRLLLLWQNRLNTKWGISASAGYITSQGTDHILTGFAASRKACERRFFEGLGGRYAAAEAEVKEDGGSNVIDGGEKQDWTPFFDMIRAGEPASLAVSFACARWRSGSLAPDQVKQEACGLLKGVYRLQEEDESLLTERLDLLLQSETLEQLSGLLLAELEEIGKALIPIPADLGYGGQVIMKALDHIADHFTDHLTLQSVADAVHLSKSYFSLLFKKQTGRNFIDYLIELRIREAKRLLSQEDGRVYDVARAAGFNDVKYFSKVFKKATGFTPMEYREKHQPAESPVM